MVIVLKYLITFEALVLLTCFTILCTRSFLDTQALCMEVMPLCSAALTCHGNPEKLLKSVVAAKLLLMSIFSE